jgi:AcrR family transcriptional regulator
MAKQYLKSRVSSSSVTAAPQQERSARRLAGFLQAAAELFAETGFNATTMQAIADRSASSIGALYNYFPDKQSVAATLLSRYAEELQWRLQSVMEHSEKLSTVQFAGAFIDCIIEFAQERPCLSESAYRSNSLSAQSCRSQSVTLDCC